MTQDEDCQQSISASKAQAEGSEAKNSADSHESASTLPAAPAAKTKMTEPSNNAIIAEVVVLPHLASTFKSILENIEIIFSIIKQRLQMVLAIQLINLADKFKHTK